MSRQVKVSFSAGPTRNWTHEIRIETQHAFDRFCWLMEMAGQELMAIGALDDTLSRRHPKQRENVGEAAPEESQSETSHAG